MVGYTACWNNRTSINFYDCGGYGVCDNEFSSIQIKEIDALVPCRIKVWREKYSTYPIFAVCCLSNIHVYWKVSTF